MSGLGINRKKLLIVVGAVMIAALLLVGVVGYLFYRLIEALPH